MASSFGSTPESAKKQVCITARDVPAEARVGGDLEAVDDEEPKLLLDDLLLHLARAAWPTPCPGRAAC